MMNSMLAAVAAAVSINGVFFSRLGGAPWVSTLLNWSSISDRVTNVFLIFDAHHPTATRRNPRTNTTRIDLRHRKVSSHGPIQTRQHHQSLNHHVVKAVTGTVAGADSSNVAVGVTLVATRVVIVFGSGCRDS